MEKEKKVIKFVAEVPDDDSDEIRAELAYAMLESKRVRRLVDLFLLALFLLVVAYILL